MLPSRNIPSTSTLTALWVAMTIHSRGADIAPAVRTSETNTEEVLLHRVPAAPGGTLKVRIEFGSIEVSTNSTSEVVFDSLRRISMGNRKKEAEFLEDRPIRISEEGDTLVFTAVRKDASGGQWNWNILRNRRTEAKLRISVPPRFKLELDTAGGPISVADVEGQVKADTSGGSLRFSRIRGPIHGDTSGGGIHVDDSVGEIHVDTSGGGIEVKGGGGSLHADTSGGPISVRNFNGPATVDTSGGGIVLEKVGGALNGSTSGGGIQAELPSPVPGDVYLETSGGGITVRTASDAKFHLDAESSGGGVSSELPVSSPEKRERDELRGQVNGGGPKVHLRTSGGGIRIKKTS